MLKCSDVTPQSLVGGLGLLAALGLGAAVSLQPLAIAALVVALFGFILIFLLVITCVHRSAFAAVILLLIFTLNRPLSNAFLPDGLDNSFAYLDDLALGICLVTLLVTLQPGRSIIPNLTWAGFLVFGAAGVASAVAQSVPVGTWGLGAWLALKLPIALWTTTRLRWSTRDRRALTVTVVAIVAINMLVSVLELVAPISVRNIFGLTGSIDRLGLTSLKGIFEHPAQSSTFLLFALSLFLSSPKVAGRWAVLATATAVLALLSLRLKTLINVGVIYSLKSLTSTRRVTREMAPLTIGVLIVGLGIGGSALISAQLPILAGTDGSSPRLALYGAAVRIGHDQFPLGAGYGRFGSQVSVTSYSPLYREYGLSDQYGFTETNPAFAKDAGWASALGEAGWLGALGLAVALTILWLSLARQATGGQEARKIPALLFLSAFILDSVASPRIFDGFASVALGLLLSLAFRDTGDPYPSHALVDERPGSHRSTPSGLRSVQSLESGNLGKAQ